MKKLMMLSITILCLSVVPFVLTVNAQPFQPDFVLEWGGYGDGGEFGDQNLGLFRFQGGVKPILS